MNNPQQLARDENSEEPFSGATHTKPLNLLRFKVCGKPLRTLMPMLGGISVAVISTLFFTWKIIAPHLPRSNQAETSQSTWIDEQSVQQTQQSTQSLPLLSEKDASQQWIEQVDAPVHQEPIAKPSVNELEQINARFDGLEQRITTLQQALAQLRAANSEFKRALAERSIAAQQTARQTMRQAYKQARTTEAKQKAPASVTAAAKQTKQEKGSSIDSATQPALQLKAVLEGRAWLQTKSGATLTVSAGEVVPGIGVVKFIDAERGQVVFANGAVLR